MAGDAAMPFRRRVKETPSSEGPLAEYNALRQEILQIQTQALTVFTFFVSTAGGIFLFALSIAGNYRVLLVIPPFSYFMFGRYDLSRVAMQRIGAYIRQRLAPVVQGGLGWEEWLLSQASHVPQSRLGWGFSNVL